MVTPLVVSTPGESLAHAIGAQPEGVEVVQWDLSGPPPRDHIDIVVPPYLSNPANLRGVADASPRLVQGQAIGFDGVAENLPAGIPFANGSSVHETATAELTLTLILAAERGIPDFVRAAGERRWATAMYPGLADKRVLVVGAGGIGNAIVDRLAPFEVDVTRVARTARTDAHGPVHAIDELPELLPNADVVVLIIPLTDESRNLVDDAFLAAMPDGALLVNVARGGVVDTDALLAHTRNGRLRAALDVTAPEPLPADHELWGLPNVLISPHVGGATEAMLPRMAALLNRQIGHMLAGRAPENIVIEAQA